jgi:hypothetical protein
MAFDKKGGGVRPIAIGITLRRLASKVQIHVPRLSCSCILIPDRLALESLVAAKERCTSPYILQSFDPGMILFKLDFSNALNSLHKPGMLLSVRDKIPELNLYVHSAY